jgi:hypothetical protein
VVMSGNPVQTKSARCDSHIPGFHGQFTSGPADLPAFFIGIGVVLENRK